MKVEDIRKLSDEEIIAKISEMKKELFNLRLKNSTGQLEKTSDIKKNKKAIARMQTILTERKLNNGGEK